MFEGSSASTFTPAFHESHNTLGVLWFLLYWSTISVSDCLLISELLLSVLEGSLSLPSPKQDSEFFLTLVVGKLLSTISVPIQDQLCLTVDLNNVLQWFSQLSDLLCLNTWLLVAQIIEDCDSEKFAKWKVLLAGSCFLGERDGRNSWFVVPAATWKWPWDHKNAVTGAAHL